MILPATKTDPKKGYTYPRKINKRASSAIKANLAREISYETEMGVDRLFVRSVSEGLGATLSLLMTAASTSSCRRKRQEVSPEFRSRRNFQHDLLRFSRIVGTTFVPAKPRVSKIILFDIKQKMSQRRFSFASERARNKTYTPPRPSDRA